MKKIYEKPVFQFEEFTTEIIMDNNVLSWAYQKNFIEDSDLQGLTFDEDGGNVLNSIDYRNFIK